ncbi:hypothetical protein Vretimale_8984 [Volvox reticuliferus]|uniref:Sulfatase N-terminal domain-containing protein n=1 Tax=Volvox reticuliferus TaxID=1737510 RepID=A0A8J4GBV5_9CHLO|nr:hypothetical protein Vretifemale_14443 [Volvox reticuliferus]GIM04400.1 hypothetical protein Vretimale_8984 [Volvox reticuliferus]
MKRYERELYDLTKDPGELRNIYDKTRAAIQNRLEALLAVLVVCKGQSCTNPWKVLHPDGSVSSWSQSLDKQYDKYYAGLTPFYYRNCLPYQDYSNEVSSFRSQTPPSSSATSPRHRRMYTWTAGIEDLVRSNPSRQQSFVASIERHSVPVPPDVLQADVNKWFDNPLPLA